MRKENKILLITNIPTPYRLPLFNELNGQLENKGLKLKVIFGALGYPRRKWELDMSECQFDYKVLFSKKIGYSDPEKTSFTYSGLYRVISEENPSVIITNAFSIATAKLWLRSFLKGNIRYIIWSGAIKQKYNIDSFLRKLQRKMLIKRAAGFVAYGSKAKEYLISLGADPEKIEIGINTVDTEFYRQETGKMRNLENRNNKKHILYIGHLSQRKNVSKVLEGINLLSKSRSDFLLDIVGDGEESKRLEKYVDENQLIDYVMFHGFKQKSDIPQFMAQSDCFLFQTDFDIWGLVLVEAMAAGLPCIASIHAGATHDLIRDEITGFAMDFSETEKVAEKINWILDNHEQAKEIGQNASRFIEENVSIEKSAEGFVKAVIKAIRGRD
jgi:glycosyltransferase involved in cell wall biosynthesis